MENMNFMEYYNSIKQEFKSLQLFTSIQSLSNPIEWPNSSGVYTIWEKVPKEMDKLIYIGMTGKFSRNNDGAVIFNKASFQSRAKRWTPYRFCEHERDNELRFHFRYGPKESNTSKQGRKKHDLNAYNHSISYESLEIHCFHINSNHPKYTPILIESLLLTKYIKEIGSLPPANNSL